jgi:hypothetical protein
MFAVCSLVVIVSVVLHGGSPMLLTHAARKRALKETAGAANDDVPGQVGSAPVTPQAVALTSQDGAQGERLQIGSQRISIEELRALWQSNEPVIILDVRTERSLEDSDLQAQDALRMPPDHTAERARELGLKQEAWIIAYCT